ncbi:MAG TPA: hypothetical protein VFI31_13410, partial [Pirellulales bacterium]|nr:hypothetical protein [Pirellulales bacterium]
ILRRGGAVLEEASGRLKRAAADDLARPHLIWLAAASAHADFDQLARLTSDQNAEIRLQALRALTEAIDQTAPAASASIDILLSALGDADPQVQHAALLACFGLDGDVPDAVLAGPARSSDSYLRQTAALLLAERATDDQLSQLCKSDDAPGRLAGVLAIGFRLTVPPATRPIASDLPLAKLPNEEQYVIQFADAKVDLREHGRIGSFTVAEHWRAGKHSEAQERLFERLLDIAQSDAAQTDANEAVRLQAAYFLKLLSDARSEPAVAKVIQESEERRLAVAPLKGVGRVWLTGPFLDRGQGFGTIHPPETGPVDVSAVYSQGDGKIAWNELTNATHCDLFRKFGRCDDASFYIYFQLETVRRERVRLMVGSDDGVKVWHNGREVWSNPAQRAALPLADLVTLDLSPGGNDVLLRVQNNAGECGFYLHYRALGNVAARMPEKFGADTLAERLKAASAHDVGMLAPEFLQVDWQKSVAEGDPSQGRRLFEKLGCAKCHAASADAATTGGPSLADAARRFTLPYLVESVLAPSKQVSPLFRRSSIETEGGQALTGLVVSETADELELLQNDGTRRTLPKGEIAERQLQDLSPMPAGIVKTPAELADLLAYLLRGEN